ncbi:CRISPR system precrRNA processing endoribonuclease RAMP protein Cas6 [Chloroflexus sp.]|uniref:CRISPR system precrRNA processing endoribonuclease RAMP protein Cas6 n=1 Tax=Chloroflexus sp. TaxID=1904827 RepID=UPI002ACE5531|nr:CRISPR system precrRNA processing endoribonuclease RAMP protein Cas6 [Chloroflexus sp.]
MYIHVPWEVDYRPAIAAAQQVTVEDDTTRWVDWERTSTHPSKRQSMVLGGLVGAATLRNVPPVVRSFLLAASVVHAGKSCVFGHGWIEVRPLR